MPVMVWTKRIIGNSKESYTHHTKYKVFYYAMTFLLPYVIWFLLIHFGPPLVFSKAGP